MNQKGAFEKIKRDSKEKWNWRFLQPGISSPREVNESSNSPVTPMMIVTGRLTPAITKTEICLTKLDLLDKIDEEEWQNAKWAPRMARGIRRYSASADIVEICITIIVSTVYVVRNRGVNTYKFAL